MKARSKRKSIQQEKDKPNLEQIETEDFLATPSTAGRVPDHTGRRGRCVSSRKEVKLQP